MNKRVFITKSQFKTFISENISKDKPKIISFQDKSSIKQYALETWKILETSYEKIGGFYGFESINDLKKKTSCLTLGFIENKVAAVAVYNAYLGGHKLVGCGTAHGKKEEKEILQAIIKTDIEEYHQWHWAEVSGVLEYWFKKYNGYPIPAEFAQIANGNKKITPLDDGFHYSRLIKNKETTKIMYGFKDKELYNNVINAYEDYFGFRKKINNDVNEEREMELMPQKEKKVATLEISDIIFLCEPFYKMVKQNSFYLSENMLSYLQELNNLFIKIGYIENDVLEKYRKSIFTIIKYGEIIRFQNFKKIEDYIIKPAF